MAALGILWEQIDELVRTGQHEVVKTVLSATRGMEYCNDLKIVWAMLPACEQEKAQGQRTIFDKVSGLEELLNRFTRLKFYLRRIEFDIINDTLDEFYRFLVCHQVSSYELLTVVGCSVLHKEKVLQVISRGTQR